MAGCAAPRAGPTGDAGVGSRNARTESNETVELESGPGPGNPDHIVENGFPRTLCDRPPVKNVGIRAVVGPAYARSWDEISVPEEYRLGVEVGAGLTAQSQVVGVERDGAARAYPLSVLWWHEVVNDDLNGPVLVTYCPLCQSGMVAKRVVDEQAATFRVSGHLWQPPRIYTEASVLDGRTFGASATESDAEVRNSGNLVLVDDATESYWSQLLARAVCGPAAGTRLEILPSTVTTWDAWQRDHPETDVLLPPPHSAVTREDERRQPRRQPTESEPTN